MSSSVNEQPAQQTNENQAELARQAEEHAKEAQYRFEHADGTVATAETVEKAREVCPVLGGMATEQAQVLLELSKVGSEIIEKKELATQAKQEAEAVTRTSVEPDMSKKIHDKEVAEQEIETPHIERSAIAQPQPARAESSSETIAAPDYASVLKELANYEASMRAEDTAPEATEPPAGVRKIEKAKAVPDSITEQKPAELKEDIALPIRIYPERETIIETAEINAPEPVVHRPETNTDVPEQPIITELYEAEAEPHKPEVLEGGLLIIDHEPTEGRTIEFEPQEPTAEAYTVYSLIEEIENQRAAIQALVTVPEAALGEPEITADQDFNTTNQFKEYIEQLPSPAEPVTIESIIDLSGSEPLEKTFIHLSELFAAGAMNENLSAPHSEQIERITGLVELIQKELDSQRRGARNEQTTIVKLTPEITQNLLDLLRAVGYKDPDQALLTFMEDHDTRFLFDAIRYLHQLQHTEFQQEFLHYQQALRSTIGPVSKIASAVGHILLAVMNSAAGSQLYTAV